MFTVYTLDKKPQKEREVFHPNDNETGESETQTRDNWDSRDSGIHTDTKPSY